LRWPWGGLGVALYSTVYGSVVALGWPWGGLGWLCAALFLISAFSFQHFSFCPIVALGWLARPVTNHESRITSGFGWLCAALFPISAFSFQHFSFCPIVALGWLARPVTNHESRITSGFGWLRATSFLVSAFSFQHFSFCPIVALEWLARPVTNHESRITSGFSWLCPAVQGSRFKVQGSKFSVFHKHTEYSSPLAPLSGWSGGGLVPLWYLRIPMAYLKHLLFNQSRLSKPLSRGFSALKRFSGLDTWRWMPNMHCPRPEKLTRKADLANRSQPG
jgi:hypothetical protein